MMEYDCIVKMVRKKLEVEFAAEPDGFKLMCGDREFQFRVFDKKGMPYNWLKLDLYEDAKGDQERLRPGIRGFFETEMRKEDCDKKRIKINIEPDWTTLRKAPSDGIKAAMETLGQHLPGNYYVELEYSLEIKLGENQGPDGEAIQICGRQMCMAE